MPAALNSTAIATITNVFKLMSSKGLTPSLPWGSSLIPNNFQVSKNNQLTQDELTSLLDNLYLATIYQETATAMSVNLSEAIYPITLSTIDNKPQLDSANFLMRAIAQPTLTAAQRGIIKKSILRALGPETITPETFLAFDQLLYNTSVESNNLTQENLKALLDVFAGQATQLSINANSTFPIFLGTALSPETNLEDTLFSAITSKSKNSSGLSATQQPPTPFLLNFSVSPSPGSYTIAPNPNMGATAPDADKLTPDMDATCPNAKPQPQPIGEPMINPPDIVEKPIATIAPKRAKVIETHDFSFWKCCGIKQKLIHYQGTKEDEEAAKLLVSSRTYYINLRDNSNQAALYSGLIIGTLVTLLEAIRQTNPTKASLARGLDLTLLIVPILLGLISKICNNLASSTQEKIDKTDQLLRDMDIDIETGGNRIADAQSASASYRPFSSARISP